MPRIAIVATVGVLILAAAAAIEWYSHTLAAISMGGPVPLQSLAPRRAAPALSPVPRASAPAVKATIEPAVAQASTPVPARGPKIVSVSLSSPVVTGGQVVTGTVQTSSDVTGVQASIAGYSSPLTKVASGYFAFSYRVPVLPFFLHRTYTVQVVARNAAGATASSSLPITIR